jgi:hypothetical protein
VGTEVAEFGALTQASAGEAGRTGSGAGEAGRTGPGGAVRRAEPTAQGAGQESPQGVELGW